MKLLSFLVAATLAAIAPPAFALSAAPEERPVPSAAPTKQALTAEQVQKLAERAEAGDPRAVSELQADIAEFDNPWSINALAYLNDKGLFGKKDPETSSPCSFSHVNMFGMTPAGIGTSVRPKSDSLFILAGCDSREPYLVKDRIASVAIDGLLVKR